jgi:predicted GTPase
MNIDNKIDVQCIKIANGLATLKEVMGQTLARKVLELETNLESGKNIDQLIRLERSLLQYLERKGDLLYVGLMGHFSSGKSSTVNSLLNLWGSEHAREVSLNPTDKTITLITHPQNSKSLIGLKSEGSIPVRAEFIDHDLLKNLVLADTPGSGDTLLVNEMVRDFLPVCDIILYFLSATNPFTAADTPMLEAKTKELQFIPMKFVITRGDEFRRDKSALLSDDNFDAMFAERFLEGVTSRVGKILGASPDKTEDVIIIDNRCGHNINHLKDFLISQSDTQDSSRRVLMHGHKVAYFISHAQAIQLYFKRLLDQKTDVLKKIVDHAKVNIARYQDKVQITNNKLTESWMKNRSSMDDVRLDLLRKLDELKQGLTLTGNPFDEGRLKDWQQSVANEIEYSANYQLTVVVNRLESVARAALTDFFQRLKTTVKSTKIDELRISNLNDISQIDLNLGASTPSLNLPHTLETKVGECYDILSGIMRNKFDLLMTGLNSLHSRLVGLQPLRSLEDIVVGSVTSIEDDIKTYFENVYVYRSGVFAIQVREAIAKLGIEKELDEVESEFQEDFKVQVVREAKDQIFPEVNTLIPLFTGRLKNLLELCKEQREAVRAFEIKDTKPAGQINQDVLYDTTAWIKVVNEYGKQIDKYLTKILKETYTKLGNILTEYNLSRSNLKKKRKKRLRNITILFGIIGLIIFLVYYYFDYVPKQTIPIIFTIGIASTLMGDIIGYVFARLTDKSPERVTALQKEYEKKLLNDCQEIIDAELKEFHLSDLPSQSLSLFLEATWNKKLEIQKDQTLNSQVSSDYGQVRNFAQEFMALIDSYRLLVDEISRKLTSYFCDIDSNLERLQNISKSISTVAIEPSFQLLDRTHQDLLQVRETIATTAFV